MGRYSYLIVVGIVVIIGVLIIAYRMSQQDERIDRILEEGHVPAWVVGAREPHRSVLAS